MPKGVKVFLELSLVGPQFRKAWRHAMIYSVPVRPRSIVTRRLAGMDAEEYAV